MAALHTHRDELIGQVRASPLSDFYRVVWKEHTQFAGLPAVSREDFIRVPLSGRRYKNERALVKIVHDVSRVFLSEWSFSDIGAEEFGLISARPLVYMTDPYEAIEKSMWCYERGIVPLIGEKDPDIAMFAAAKYQIDSLVTDAPALPKLLPYFEKMAKPLSSISIIGSEFDVSALAKFQSYAERVRLVLALPETGAFAEADLADTLRFTALSDCTIERDKTLVVTKERLLVTPVIRYRTNIPEALYDGT